jgi:hypothetical protein
LVNYVMQQIANRARRQQQQTDEPVNPVPPPMDEPLDYTWGREGSALAPVYEPSQPALAIASRPPTRTIPAPTQEHTAVRMLFRSKSELRHAVVLMTVLGPCRAIEPYDEGRP